MMQDGSKDNSAEPPEFKDAVRVWAKIGIASFGGPAAQIALMHRMIVEENRWLSEQQFLNALNFCMLLPGPEAMQLATYAGWRMHGVKGGLAAGLLFVLPGAAVIMALAAFYSNFGNVAFVESLFLGVKAAVLVIVVEALIKVSRRALNRGVYYLFALASFVAIYFLQVPFPVIIVVAALLGAFLTFSLMEPDSGSHVDAKTSIGSTLNTIVIWGFIWLLPMAFLWSVGAAQILIEISVFFSKLAVVTFGGAYAVLAYMAQDVVGINGWLDPDEMVDGLGLAETTPGPLILVTEFVGFLAAEKVGGFWMGVAGALVTLWVTFVPCFLWIFAGAPYIEQISGQPRLKGALSAITAVVVGVILNLSIWFAVHVLFSKVTTQTAGPFSFAAPVVSTIDWNAALLAVFSAVLLLGFRFNLLLVLLISAILGVLLSLL